MAFGLTEHGRREVLLGTALAILLLAGLGWLGAAIAWWWWPVAIVPAALWAWLVWFFRDPERAVPPGEDSFVSPADGCVADITPVGADSPLGCEGTQIGIFMNIFNVHVNRVPCSGRVESIHHQPGAFLDARNPDATTRNESTTIRMSHRQGTIEYPVLVRQVAGLVARRIVTTLTAGQVIEKGMRFGMIKFGSRLEIHVPNERIAEIHVRVGQKVKAGETVLLVTKGPQAP